jgi:hemolysin D
MLRNLKRTIEDIDWQEVAERLNPERVTKDPRFERFMQRLNLPDYVKGPTDETEFLPAALEIVETPPSPASRIVARVIIAFFGVALLWSIFGSVDIIAMAEGKIVSAGRTKVIQPFETGVVRKIDVQDGQSVKAGDTLIEIDSTINEAERDRLHKEYIEAELNVARLKAALAFLDDPAALPESKFEPPEGATPSQIETQKTLLINQTQEIVAKLSGLDQQIAKEQGNLDSVQSEIDKLNQSIPLLQKRADAEQYLAKRGYGSKLESLKTQQDLVEHQQDLQVQRGRLVEATAAVASLQQQRKQAEAEWRRTTLDQLTQDGQKAASLQEQLVQAAQKFRLQTLTAPVDGTVQQLAVHTEGGVVTPAEVLMAIAPADSHLEIEAMVSNRDIGFVQAGQEAAIKIDTFDYTKYGLLPGRVISVSQDAILRDDPTAKSTDKTRTGDKRDSSEPKGQTLVYSARVTLDQTQMQIDDRMVNLVPGMAVTVEIKTGSRRIISYLLSPIQKHMHSALRER